MSPRRTLAWGVLGACCLVLPGNVSAQSIPGLGELQQADTTGRQAVPPPPAAIPLEQVPRRFEQDIERLRQIHHGLGIDSGYSRARGELDQILQGVGAILDNFESLPIQELHSSDLNDFRQSLQREQSRLTRRSNDLEKRFLELESDERESDRMRLEWALTRDSAGLDTVLAPSFEAGIDRILAAADSVGFELESRLADLLQVSDQVAVTGGRIGDALERIDDAESLNRRMLLIRDAPPLWRPAAVLSDGRPAVGDVTSFVSKDIRAFRQSLGADRDRALIHILLFFLTLALFLRLRAGSLDWPEDPDLDTARYLLSRPYAAAALTALLATSWIYPHASLLVFDVALILTLLPVAWLLPPLVLEARRPAVYGLFALFLASRLVGVLPPDSIARRLVMLGLAIGSAVWAAWLLRADRLGESNFVRGSWRTPFRLGLKLALAISLVSAVLNIAGWVDLGEVLIEGVIPSAYFGVVIALAAMIISGVARGIAFSRLVSRSRAFSDNRDRVLGLVTTVIRLGALVIWFWGTLAWFGVDRAIFGRLGALFTHEFSIGAVDISIGRVLLFFLILWFATWVGRVVRVVLRDDILASLSISPGQADAWATLAQWATLLVGILFAAASAGIGGGQMAVLAGALGVGIGFGLQNIVNNFVSGFILIFEQPIKVGDKIEISSLGLLGEVRRIGIRSSTIRTVDGADVVVPNSNLIQSEVINWTLSDTKRRIEVAVGVKYGTDPKRVLELLLAVARDNSRVLSHPEPVALFTGFGDSSLDFILRVWSATFDESIRLRSDIAVEVNDALKAAEIEIPFPQRDLHVRSVDPDIEAAFSGGARAPEPSPATPDPSEEST
jgi:small-conductance mechanosensitive channel